MVKISEFTIDFIGYRWDDCVCFFDVFPKSK